MGKDSHIEWTDHTWNIARGCTKVDSDCKFCYMYRDSYGNQRYDPMQVVRTKTVFNFPLKLKEPSKIFTSSLTDVFHEAIDPYRKEMWEIIMKCPQHTFQILTKRPERINQNLYVEKMPDGMFKQHRNMPNVWLGTSIGSQEGLRRLSILGHSVWRGFKFLSLEPLHGPIDFEKQVCDRCGAPIFDHAEIGWVIIGGESGNDIGKYRYRECNIEWIESLIEFCKHSGVPVFIKQLGTHLAKKMKLKDRHGRDWNEWPEHLRIREMPKV